MDTLKEGEVKITEGTKSISENSEVAIDENKPLGLQWLHFTIVVGVVFGLISVFQILTNLDKISFLQLIERFFIITTVCGLYLRAKWGFYLNLFNVYIVPLNIVIFMSSMGMHNEVIMIMFLLNLLAIWPQHVYWMKRKHLFS